MKCACELKSGKYLLMFMGGFLESSLSQPIQQLCITHPLISVIYILMYYEAQTHTKVAIKIYWKVESCNSFSPGKISWQFSPEKLVARLEVLVLELLEVEQLEDGNEGVLGCRQADCYPSITISHTCQHLNKAMLRSGSSDVLPATAAWVVAATQGCPGAPTNEPLS